MCECRCLAENKDWEECLELLGGLEIDDPDQLHFSAPPSEPGAQLDYISAVCLLRGKAYDALENFPRAIHWYKSALIKDPFNQDAFHKLIGCHKLTEKEERELITNISALIPEQHKWLALLYRCSCKQFDNQSLLAAEHALNCLENHPSALDNTITEYAATDYAKKDAPKATPASRTRRKSAAAMNISPITEEGSPHNHHITATPLHTPLLHAHTSAAHKPLPSDGWGLTRNADITACRANLLYHIGRYQEAFSLSSSTLERDPYSPSVLPIHVASAVQLGKKNDLFMLSHRLIKAHAQHALSWYAAGCYYYTTKQFNAARQYFSKATTLDPSFAPAWISFALSFAALDETDQAMAGYRTAARLFPGLYEPLLGMGLEYSKMNNFPLAEQMLIAAYAKCPKNASIAHELGTLCYRSSKQEDAVRWLVLSIHLAVSIAADPLSISSSEGDALGVSVAPSLDLAFQGGLVGIPPTFAAAADVTTHTIITASDNSKAFDSLSSALGTLTALLSSSLSGTVPSTEISWVNLGHALRKLNLYELAVQCFTRALGISPCTPGTFAALGYTNHLMGNVQQAIEHYHKALGLKAEDSFVSMMLGIALEEYTNIMDVTNRVGVVDVHHDDGVDAEIA